MKIQSLLFIGIIFLFSNCSKNSRLPEFSFNDTTYLKFQIKNCHTPGSFTLSYVSICPLEQNDLNFLYKKDTSMLLRLSVNHAVTINLLSPKINATCFNLPKDTLEIILDFSPRIRGKDKITFKGTCATISNYLTYSKVNTSSFPSRYRTVRDYTSQVDNLTRKAISELNRFDSRTPLPKWFKKMEETDIKYSGSKDKVYQFKIRQRYNFRDQIIPEDFLKNLDVRLNNPKAKYSLSYYGFLNNYSTLNFYKYLDRQDIGPNETYLYIIENIKAAQKLLHSEIKELYTAQRICMFLSDRMVRQALEANDRLYFQRVDSLINSAMDNFKDDEILNALLDYQRKQLKLTLN